MAPGEGIEHWEHVIFFGDCSELEETSLDANECRLRSYDLRLGA